MSKSLDGTLINGLSSCPFRRVVVCGSFQQHMKEINDVINKLNSIDAEVLSPWTMDIVPESIGTDFILLKGQTMENARDAWRHKYDHMAKFAKSDAVVVCNPGGRVGKGTMFEVGYMIACNCHIIFTEQPNNIGVPFPFDVGLDI